MRSRQTKNQSWEQHWATPAPLPRHWAAAALQLPKLWSHHCHHCKLLRMLRSTHNTHCTHFSNSVETKIFSGKMKTKEERTSMTEQGLMVSVVYNWTNFVLVTLVRWITSVRLNMIWYDMIWYDYIRIKAPNSRNLHHQGKRFFLQTDVEQKILFCQLKYFSLFLSE